MKDMKRAERRRHLARVKKERRSYWGGTEKSKVQIGMLAHSAALCSCWMCCNPRHALKGESQTIQERRFWQKV